MVATTLDDPGLVRLRSRHAGWPEAFHERVTLPGEHAVGGCGRGRCRLLALGRGRAQKVPHVQAP
jgi:hypothetical protein